MRVSKVTYVLLAFLLGWIGVHKFYSNQVFLGVLHIIFFWTGIPYVVAIISGIITIFFKKADKDGMIVFY